MCYGLMCPPKRYAEVLTPFIYDLIWKQGLCGCNPVKMGGPLWPWPVWFSWLGSSSLNPEDAGSIPSQGTCLGYRLRPWSGCTPEATD